MHKAARDGKIEEVQQYLVQGGDPDVVDEKGCTMLWKASWRGHLDVIDILLRSRAAVDLADGSGTTPLIIAAHKGHRDCVELLLRHGADLSRTDSGGNALENAQQRGHVAIAELLEGLTPIGQLGTLSQTGTVLTGAAGAGPSTAACEALATAERMLQDVELAHVDLELEKLNLKEAQRKLDEKEEELQRSSRQQAMPAHWDASLHAQVSADQFVLAPIDQIGNSPLWEALQAFLQTNPAELSKGKDVRHYTGPYDRLRLACAWRLQHKGLWAKYAGGQQQVAADMRQLRKQRGGQDMAPGLPAATNRHAAALLHAEGKGMQLKPEVNETWLMHATHAGVLLDIISKGMNERFSGSNAGTAFGDGIYLAEDAGKNDQYGAPDAQYNRGSELHRRLYARTRHPGHVFYLIVARTSLGYCARTMSVKDRAVDVDTKEGLFPISYRELAKVPWASPAVNYHSLLGLAYPRFREFITFHGEYTYPDYVLAYQRFKGNAGPVP